LIDRAESLRESLQTALADTRNLITTLKQQQKTSRSVQSALKSLRQLEALEV
jgi:signal transduction histidine kinase